MILCNLKYIDQVRDACNERRVPLHPRLYTVMAPEGTEHGLNLDHTPARGGGLRGSIMNTGFVMDVHPLIKMFSAQPFLDADVKATGDWYRQFDRNTKGMFRFLTHQDITITTQRTSFRESVLDAFNGRMGSNRMTTDDMERAATHLFSLLQPEKHKFRVYFVEQFTFSQTENKGSHLNAPGESGFFLVQWLTPNGALAS